MKNPIIMHINYCEQGQTMLKACENAVKWGFDGIEFRAKRPGSAQSCEEYLDELKLAVEKTGLKFVLFGLNADLMKPDEQVRQTEIDNAKNFLKLAKERFPLTVINVFSGAMISKYPELRVLGYEFGGAGAAEAHHWEWASNGYKVIGEYAKSIGVKLAFETHMNYIHDLPANAKKLCEKVDNSNVGINLDYGNSVYFKAPPALKASIIDIKDFLFYVHLKNSTGLAGLSRTPVGLGDGIINHREYIMTLNEIGFEGPIAVEGPRQGDREYFAQQDLAYIKSLLSDIG